VGIGGKIFAAHAIVRTFGIGSVGEVKLFPVRLEHFFRKSDAFVPKV
jgi:hypothetical protein